MKYSKIIRETIERFLNFDDKKIRAVIFDFDLTLVDTTVFEEVKQYAIIHRDFSVLMDRIPYTKPYSGIRELISELRKRGILVLVVTNNKQSVAQSTLQYHGIKCDAIRGAQSIYGKRVPKSVRMLNLLKKAAVNPEEALSVGDLPSDGVESNAVGIRFIGCTWGNNATNGINNPMDLIKIIDEYEEY